jgi:hypothetical protein
MSKGLPAIIKLSLITAVLALAIVASLYALDVFPSEAARQTLTKLMAVIGIWTAASLLIFIITAIGQKNPPQN